MGNKRKADQKDSLSNLKKSLEKYAIEIKQASKLREEKKRARAKTAYRSNYEIQ